jgi:two-component system CitB family sensor kinase
VSADRGELTDQVTKAIGEPKLAALVLAKMSLAAECGVRLRVMPDSQVGARIGEISAVLTVVGNLIDNAIDAAAQSYPGGGASGEHAVELTLVAAERDLMIRVRDTGPGVPPGMRGRIFTDGVTTKESVTGAQRGLGLALVRKVIDAQGGMISVGQDVGAVFTAILPGSLEPEGLAPALTREPR